MKKLSRLSRAKEIKQKVKEASKTEKIDYKDIQANQ
jgi:hypothetical protein